MSKERFNLLKNIPYKVLHTLIKNKCLSSYLDQLVILDHKKFLCNRHWITRAFVWKDTREGYRFWKDIRYQLT